MSNITIVPFLNKVNALILNPLIELIFAISFVYFIYGIIKFVRTDADDKSATRSEARSAIMWGIVGMVIMFSVYGLIAFVLNTFGVSVNPTADQFLH
jgi:hypothetical protein